MPVVTEAAAARAKKAGNIAIAIDSLIMVAGGCLDFTCVRIHTARRRECVDWMAD